MLAFVKLGYTVVVPYGGSERYDYLVDFNGQFVRIQCKTAHEILDGAGFAFDVRSRKYDKKGQYYHIQYSADEIDYFATAFKGKCYLVPVGYCNSQVKLRLYPNKNHGGSAPVWAEDYELEKVVKQWQKIQ